MSEVNGTVIDIDKNKYMEADFMSRRFINAEIRNRAYINVFGAELVTDYLAKNKIDTEDIISLHSISKIVENLDIADIQLENIYIDVRTVFDEKKIFIPKSHFEYGIVPDIYVVLKLTKNFRNASILGYFKPSQINKNKANDEYYFFEKDKLSNPDTLLKTISKFTTSRDKKLSEEEFLNGRELSVGYSDNNLEISQLKEFYRLMLSSVDLRDSVAEFDNFEVLSSQVSSVLLERIESAKQAAKAVPGITALATEEVLKEGIEAVIEENTSKVEDVFEAAEETLDVVEAVAETGEKLADVFEEAPAEDLAGRPSGEPVAEQEPKSDKKLPKIEILQEDGFEAPQDNQAEESLTIEENEAEVSEDTKISEPEINENQIDAIEDEPALTIEDELLPLENLEENDISIQEELPASEIDTVNSDETDISAEENEIENEIESEIESEIENDRISDEEISIEIAEETVEEPLSIDKEQDTEASTEENAVLEIEDELLPLEGLSDDDLTLDEDIQAPDIDTLSSDEITQEAVQQEIVEDNNDSNDESETQEELTENIEIQEEQDVIEDSLEVEEIETLSLDEENLSLGEDIQIDEEETVSETSETQTGTEMSNIQETEKVIEETEILSDTALEIKEDNLIIDGLGEELSLDGQELPEFDITVNQEGNSQEIEQEDIQEPVPEIIEENLIIEDNEPVISNLENMQNIEEPTVTITPAKSEDMTVDMLLDNAIAAIDSNVQNEPVKQKDISSEKPVTESALKLASIAGGAVEDLAVSAIAKQAEAISHKDYSHLADSNLMPDNDNYMSFVGGLSDAKRNANLIAEAQGLVTVTDIHQLTTVEPEKQEDIVHNVVDIDKMEAVKIENVEEDKSAIVELDNIDSVESPTKPVDNIEDLSLQIHNEETMELPDLNSYTINEDGTSPLDNMNWGPESPEKNKDLLDLEAADFLLGDTTENVEIENQENLVDGTMFKSQISSFDIDAENNEEIFAISEENSEQDIILEDSLDANTTEEISHNSENIETSNEEIVIDEDINDILNDLEPAQDLQYDKEPEIVDEQTQEQEDNINNSDENNMQDWVEDTGFDSLEDAELPKNEDFITEPEAEANTPVYKVQTNSTIISSTNFQPGEINIDINKKMPVTPPTTENEPISSLFDNNPETQGTILKNPGRVAPVKQKSSNGLALGLGLTGIVFVLVLLFSLGFGISKLIKGQITDETPQPISDASGLDDTTEQNTPDLNGNVVEMQGNTNALASTAGTDTSKKSTFVEVKKLSWEVPGAVSSEPKFQQYFQSAGKSIKSALMTDLLSVTDLAYASEMRVGISFAQDGTFRDARIVTSSGSNQIDNIVLRTVNQTLNVLKAPHSVGSYENTTAVLKIYL